MSETNEEAYDPFHPENAIGLILIQQLRIYDALMAILHEQDAAAAGKLHNLHEQGQILGSLPIIDMETGSEE